ncbi:hypothetical protein HAX54_026619, partial [Datura stramonium]|nr:hypothetical protein [Datura stramonium]
KARVVIVAKFVVGAGDGSKRGGGSGGGGGVGGADGGGGDSDSGEESGNRGVNNFILAEVIVNLPLAPSYCRVFFY